MFFLGCRTEYFFLVPQHYFFRLIVIFLLARSGSEESDQKLDALAKIDRAAAKRVCARETSPHPNAIIQVSRVRTIRSGRVAQLAEQLTLNQ